MQTKQDKQRKPKTSIATSSSTKNPLAQIFGTVLKELRASQSSEQIADSLGIGFPAYRLVESGGATLLPAYSAALKKTFPSISWVRVLQFLVCSQTVSAVMPKKDDRVQQLDPAALRSKAEDVATHDPELKAVVLSFAAAFDAAAEGPERVEALIVEQGWTQRLLNFLESDSSTRPQSCASLSEWVSFAPAEIPPLHLDMLARQAEALTLFPVSVPPDKLATWETRSAHRFRRIYAVVRNLQSIAEDAQNFGWEFLLEKRFETAYIWVTEDTNPDVDSFLDTLLARRLASLPANSRTDPTRSAELRNSLRKAIEVRSLPKIHMPGLRRFLTYNPETGQLHEGKPGPGEYAMNNAWFYHMVDTRVTIGVLSDFKKRGERFISISLDSAQTLSFVRTIEEMWAKEMGPRFSRLYPEHIAGGDLAIHSKS